MPETDTWLFGDGTFGDSRPAPAVSTEKFGEKHLRDGWHLHGVVKHRHEQGNKKHRHSNNTSDLGNDSDGTLTTSPV